MATGDQLSSLIEAIRQAFRNGPPNGWLIGWDRDRLGKELVAIDPGLHWVNGTSFDYDRCNEYEAAFPPYGGEFHHELVIKISFVAPYYQRYFCLRAPSENDSGVCLPGPGHIREWRAWHAAGGILELHGLKELPDAWGSIRVEGVTLELSLPEDVTVEKCLFSDFE